MRTIPRHVAATLAAAAALLVVLTTLLLLPLSPFVLVGTLLTHAFHVAAAFAAGTWLVRLPRVVPREALDLVVTAIALGLAFLALLTLAATTLGFTHPLTPWVVDTIALISGARTVVPAVVKIVAAWRRLDLSIVVASRIPLHATLIALALPLVVAPFTPATRATGAAQLTVPTQAALRQDLPGTLAALPGSWASPSSVLLLHGQVVAGHEGARLFPLTLVGLLVAAGVLHAGRHLGSRSTEWVAACLVGSPALLLLSAADPSATFLLTYAFLAFHEAADWCQKATGGKIALASIYGGLAVAESPRGAALFGAVLAFVFIVQAVLDRNGVLRQVPGLLGMVLIASVTALLYLGIAAAARPEGVGAALRERHALQQRTVATPGVLLGTADDTLSWTPPSGPVTRLLPSLLAVGPLVLGLLLFVPVVPNLPEGLGHALLATGLNALCWLLPPPYSTGLGMLAPMSACAGGAAAALPGGPAGRLSGAFMVIAAPATLLLSLTLGPDVLGGASVLVGRTSEKTYRAVHVPDDELARAVTARQADLVTPVLLVGELTDCHYGVPIQRTIPAADQGSDAVVAALRRDKTRVALIAVDRDTTPADCPIPFDELTLIGSYGPQGRYMLYRTETFRRR